MSSSAVRSYVALTALLCLGAGCGKKPPAPAADKQDPIAELKALGKLRQDPSAELDSVKSRMIAALDSRVLFNMSSDQIERILGGSDANDWVFHASKPRFMGDRYEYWWGFWNAQDKNAGKYLKLILILRKDRCCACIFKARNRDTGMSEEFFHETTWGRRFGVHIN